MAVLTTSAAVIKDSQTREQVHKIQEHLRHLSADFERFQSRMDKLAQHIDQANRDVTLVNTSARKISGRFQKIEGLELGDEDQPKQLLSSDGTDPKDEV
jgi:DNA recombination protein RmuC